MLQQTFIHIPGIGRETERGMWANGIQNWDDATTSKSVSGSSVPACSKSLTITSRFRAKP